MGMSKTIEEKFKEDEKFREFMKHLEKESKRESERIYGQITDLVKRHYEQNKWDHARLFGDRQEDYQNYNDWSLERVSNIISSIGNALTAKDYPSKAVPGSEEASKETVENAKDFAGAFTGDYTLIVSRATALMSAVLSQFASTSSTTRKASLRDLPLSGGLHLFFGCSGLVEERSDFFANQFIGSFQIVYETYMSVAEARAIGIQQILATTQEELRYLNKMILNVRKLQMDELDKLKKDKPSLWLDTKAAYDLMLDALKTDRDKVVLEYDKYNDVVETVDHFFPRLDLQEFGGRSAFPTPIPLNHLFTEWEQKIARRYIREQLGL